MKKSFQAFWPVLAAALVFTAADWLWAGGTNNQLPASATFRDQASPAPADKIQSDGLYGGMYVHGQDCTPVWVDGKTGLFALRTRNYKCTPVTPRSITIDFSNPVSPIDPSQCTVDDALGQQGTLNICGSSLLPDVRVIADKLFAGSAISNGTTLTLPFNLQANFTNSTTTNNAAFELDFEQRVPVTGSGTYRVMTAGPDAVAELYKIDRKGNKLSLGRFYMPFQLTVTLQ